MRMFQSSSRHSSEQSTVHNSSRPTASQLKGVSDPISNWFENHRPRRTQISTVTNLLSVQSKLESNGLQVDHNRKFSERNFSTPAIFKATYKLIGSLGWSDDSTFPAFSIRIVDFTVQFLLRCKFSFHEKRRSSKAWQRRDLPQPITILCLRIAINRIASFYIDHRWRQMAFFVFVKMGKAPISRALREIKQVLCEQSLFLHYIKQIDSMLPCICPVIDHRGRQNVVRTSATHSAIASCATFLFLTHFDVICDLLQDRCTATWNLFVKLMTLLCC